MLGHAGLVLAGSRPPTWHHMGPLEGYGEAEGGRINLLSKNLGPLSQDTSAAHPETQLSRACSILHSTLNLGCQTGAQAVLKPASISPYWALSKPGLCWVLKQAVGFVWDTSRCRRTQNTKQTHPHFLSPPKSMANLKTTLSKVYLASDAN